MSSPLYNRWWNMHNRCGNPQTDNWQWYGARGIRVCKEWSTFEQFQKDMGQPPSPQHQLDRIDPEGDYCIENCRWVLPYENSANQRLRVNNTSGVPGVSFDKVRNRWVASATYRRKFLILYKGTSFETACRVRKAWEQRKADWPYSMLGDDWLPRDV